jgi:hypothetical protein
MCQGLSQENPGPGHKQNHMAILSGNQDGTNEPQTKAGMRKLLSATCLSAMWLAVVLDLAGQALHASTGSNLLSALPEQRCDMFVLAVRWQAPDSPGHPSLHCSPLVRSVRSSRWPHTAGRQHRQSAQPGRLC